FSRSVTLDLFDIWCGTEFTVCYLYYYTSNLMFRSNYIKYPYAFVGYELSHVSLRSDMLQLISSLTFLLMFLPC
ncbi:hypothetical protein L9F63_023223, partial [Diploptera punctata]